MIYTKTTVIRIFILLLFGNACDSISNSDPLEELAEHVRSGNIPKVRVLHVPYHVLTRTMVTPENLENYATLDVTLQLDKNLSTSLVSVLRRSWRGQIEGPFEIRWGVQLFDKSDNLIKSVYLSGRSWFCEGRKGFLDGVAFEADPSFVGWTQKAVTQAQSPPKRDQRK